MNKKKITITFTSIIFIFSTFVIAQNFGSNSFNFGTNQSQIFSHANNEVNLIVTDSVIIYKKHKNYKYASKVRVEINVENLKDSLFLYFFNRYVHSNLLFSDFWPFEMEKETSYGLNYIIEDKNYHIKLASFELRSYERDKDLVKNWNSRIIVTSKQKIIWRQLSCKEQNDYDLAKYLINSKKHSLELYPLIGEYHAYLPKGEYYLYFVYSYHKQLTSNWFSDEPYDTKVFNGSFVSNKVKLIVE